MKAHIAALPKLVDFAEVHARQIKLQEIIKENAHTMVPILVEIAISIEAKQAALMDAFFHIGSEDSKEVAQAKVATWKEAKRLIENLIHKDIKEEFNATRRDRR